MLFPSYAEEHMPSLVADLQPLCFCSARIASFIGLKRFKKASSLFGFEDPDGVATQPSTKEEVCLSTITIGVDLAQIISACGTDGGGHVLRRQCLRREPFGRWLARVTPGAVWR